MVPSIALRSFGESRCPPKVQGFVSMFVGGDGDDDDDGRGGLVEEDEEEWE